MKLLGAGEYVLELPGKDSAGHFGLAVRDYTHSTAPNRRYPDLITQRLVKAAIAGRAVPYRNDELNSLAKHCTEQEDAANKVERRVRKSAAALFLSARIGEIFEALVTGAAEIAAPGCECSSPPSKESWSKALMDSTLAIASGLNSSASMSSRALSISCV